MSVIKPFFKEIVFGEHKDKHALVRIGFDNDAESRNESPYFMTITVIVGNYGEASMKL